MERILCNAVINGSLGGPNGVHTTGAGSTSYGIGLPGSFTPGASVVILCSVDDGSSSRLYNDHVLVESVEFRYTATQ